MIQDAYMKMLRRYDLKRTHQNYTLADQLNHVRNRAIKRLIDKKAADDRNGALVILARHKRRRGGQFIMKEKNKYEPAAA